VELGDVRGPKHQPTQTQNINGDINDFANDSGVVSRRRGSLHDPLEKRREWKRGLFGGEMVED
jgi:hypothetical protein